MGGKFILRISSRLKLPVSLWHPGTIINRVQKFRQIRRFDLSRIVNAPLRPVDLMRGSCLGVFSYMLKDMRQNRTRTLGSLDEKESRRPAHASFAISDMSQCSQ